MKCDICGKTDFQEGEATFIPQGENKSYCYDCKEKAEQDPKPTLTALSEK